MLYLCLILIFAPSFRLFHFSFSVSFNFCWKLNLIYLLDKWAVWGEGQGVFLSPIDIGCQRVEFTVVSLFFFSVLSYISLENSSFIRFEKFSFLFWNPCYYMGYLSMWIKGRFLTVSWWSYKLSFCLSVNILISFSYLKYSFVRHSISAW